MPNQDFVKTEYTPEQKEVLKQEEMKDAFMEEAGLEGVDANYLRKTMLSAEEAVAAKTEQMEDIRARKSRKLDWEEYVDAPRRWGRAIHHSDLIRHFRNLIPNLHVEEGTIKNTLSLYVWDRTQPFQNKVGGTVFLGWLHVGWNPEYEIDVTNDVGVAVSQKRGWRTLLIRMICRRDPITFCPKSLFTEQQAEEEFGPPTNGATASKYREHLWKFRNTNPERAKMEHQILERAGQYRYA